MVAFFIVLANIIDLHNIRKSYCVYKLFLGPLCACVFEILTVRYIVFCISHGVFHLLWVVVGGG